MKSFLSVPASVERSLKFLTPTLFLLSLNVLRSDSETFVSFALQLLLKLQIACYKLFKNYVKI